MLHLLTLGYHFAAKIMAQRAGVNFSEKVFPEAIFFDAIANFRQ